MLVCAFSTAVATPPRCDFDKGKWRLECRKFKKFMLGGFDEACGEWRRACPGSRFGYGFMWVGRYHVGEGRPHLTTAMLLTAEILACVEVLNALLVLP